MNLINIELCQWPLNSKFYFRVKYFDREENMVWCLIVLHDLGLLILSPIHYVSPSNRALGFYTSMIYLSLIILGRWCIMNMHPEFCKAKSKAP